MLDETAELRHEWDDQINWRESLYFNFADAENRLGGWLYLWVLPNQEQKSGMLVSLYRGRFPDLGITDRAMEQPQHLLRRGDDEWVYCFKRNSEELIKADFDDVELNGLHLRRLEPLKRYDLSFQDDEGTELDIRCEFLTPPWDYADGVMPTPDWVAKNRYHRSWRAQGTITVPGVGTLNLDSSGDSDHSWGRRDMQEFAKHNFKMWSFQSADGASSISAIEQGAGTLLGFIHQDGTSESIADIRCDTKYSEDGVQRQLSATFVDAAGRTVEATLGDMYSYIGYGEGRNSTWGYEGVGVFDVAGWGRCSGLTSYFWPPAVTPQALHAGGQQ